MVSWRGALPLVAWLCALVVALALFHALGGGALRPPPLDDPASWGRWAEAREPVEAVTALLRLVVLVLGWYLLATTTLGLMARLLRLAGLVRLTDAVSVPIVRRLLQGALGVGLATAVVGAAAVPAPPQPHPLLAGSEAIEEAPDSGASDVSRPPRLVLGDEQAESEDGATDAPVSMRLLAEGAEQGEDAGWDEAGTAPATSDERVPARTTHEVVAGESLWSIARDAVAGARHRTPTDAEIVGYWRRVIEGNRAGLADPDDPDLIFPGDEILLPPLDEV